MRVVKMLLAVVSVFTILVCCASGSLAWLTASSAPSVSEFSVGKIDVTLKDDTNSADNTAAVLIPGTTIARDPRVTVKGGSVDCWLFVRVDAANGAGDCLNWMPADGWNRLESGTGETGTTVYYREVAASANDQTFQVVKDATLTVKSDLTRTQLASMNTPTLSFTAYAFQRASFDGVAAAWAQINTVS